MSGGCCLVLLFMQFFYDPRHKVLSLDSDFFTDSEPVMVVHCVGRLHNAVIGFTE